MTDRKHMTQGAASVWFALLLPVLVASAGIAIDIGRMYVAKTELQSFVDAGALAATAELDGTPEGLQRAAAVASAQWTKWSFGAKAPPAPSVRFGTGPSGPWLTAGDLSSAEGYRFARVETAARVPMYTVQIATRLDDATVASGSAAAQVRVTSMSEGLFPFAPMAHSSNANDLDGYGFVKGERYALRWSSNAASDVDHHRTGDFCSGDRDSSFQLGLQAAAAAGMLSDRGYIESASAATISASILRGYQSLVRTIGDALDFAGGMKVATADEMNQRARSDVNQNSYENWTAFADPLYGYHAQPHNGRRVVVVPIAHPPETASPDILDFGLFLLDPSYDKAPTKCWCAMYLGAGVAWTGRPGAAKTGLYVLKLVS